MSPSIVYFLLSTPYFSNCSVAEVARFATALQPQQIQAGWTIFQQGEIADGWFLIESGLVRINHRTSSGMNYTLTELGERESFGEMGMIDHSFRIASAIALTTTRVWFLPTEIFETLLEECNPVVVQLLRSISVTQAKRLRETTIVLRDLTDIGTQDVNETLGDLAPLDVNHIWMSGMTGL